MAELPVGSGFRCPVFGAVRRSGLLGSGRLHQIAHARRDLVLSLLLTGPLPEEMSPLQFLMPSPFSRVYFSFHIDL